MKIWWRKLYKENKAIVWAALITIILSLGILWQVKDEVTRFTLIMPIFAGFILFSILITDDEEFEDDSSKQKEDKKTPPKKTSK